jgi:hypothetical protein
MVIPVRCRVAENPSRPGFGLATRLPAIHTTGMRPRPLAAVLSLIVASATVAGPSETLIGKNTLFCDEDGRACFRGTLTYHANPRLLDLRSRVQRAEGPGMLKIRLVGRNADGHTRRTIIEVRIRGDYSEIVNTRQITDHPDVYSWQIDSISFEPGVAAQRNSR